MDIAGRHDTGLLRGKNSPCDNRKATPIQKKKNILYGNGYFFKAETDRAPSSEKLIWQRS